MKTFARSFNISATIFVLLLLASCDKSGIDLPEPVSSGAYREQFSDSLDLPPIEVTITDSLAQRTVGENFGGFSTEDQEPCSGHETLNVAGMDLQTALKVTAGFFSDACSVTWVGVGDAALGITVRREKQDGPKTEMWYVSWTGPAATSTWALGGANTADGNTIAPELSLGGTGEHGMDVLESQLFNTLNTDQQIRYANNQVAARTRLDDLLNGCGSAYIDNGTGNAFLHAYWTALNARSLGPELALKLVSAHEAHGDNALNTAAMDHYNDMVGLSIQRYHPDASAEELANRVLSSITTGHGRRIKDGIYQRTGRDLCD